MAETGHAVVQGTGLAGEPGDKIVQDEDGTLRLVKAADVEDEPCEDDE